MHYKYYYKIPNNLIEKFKEGYKILREAYIYAHRIDRYLSGDDGDDYFIKRLEEDLRNLDEELKEEKFKFLPDDEE